MAVLNAAVWAVIVPPFHVPDENTHVAYVQYLAETGKAPRHIVGQVFSDEQSGVLAGTHFSSVAGNVRNRPPWTEVDAKQVLRIRRTQPSRTGDGASHNAVNNPPLYYALQTVPYHLAGRGDLLDRMMAMRLFSALIAGGTVLFVLLFLRELLPREPYAWTVGALAVAFQPMFAFMSSGVNNDGGLFMASAVVFFALARCFRRGLTPRRGALLGLAIGLALVTKLTALALVAPGAVALVLLVLRAREDRRRALTGAAMAVVAAVGPVLVYLLLNELAWDRQVYGGVVGESARSSQATRVPNRREELSYIWQLFLPRLPFQLDLLPEHSPRRLWFDGLIGHFGWLDYAFPRAVYNAAFYVFVVLGISAAVEVIRNRAALLRRWAELVVFAAAVASLAVIIGRPSYNAYVYGPAVFEQPRYLLPLLPLYAAVLALAARGAGPRFGPVAGAAIVVLVMAHGLLAQLLTLSRYWG